MMKKWHFSCYKLLESIWNCPKLKLKVLWYVTENLRLLNCAIQYLFEPEIWILINFITIILKGIYSLTSQTLAVFEPKLGLLNRLNFENKLDFWKNEEFKIHWELKIWKNIEKWKFFSNGWKIWRQFFGYSGKCGWAPFLNTQIFSMCEPN